MRRDITGIDLHHGRISGSQQEQQELQLRDQIVVHNLGLGRRMQCQHKHLFKQLLVSGGCSRKRLEEHGQELLDPGDVCLVLFIIAGAFLS